MFYSPNQRNFRFQGLESINSGITTQVYISPQIFLLLERVLSTVKMKIAAIFAITAEAMSVSTADGGSLVKLG